MRTIRGRLTVWYATAIALTLAAFATALYLARRSASYQELDRRIQSEADLTAGILMESHRIGAPVLRNDTAGRPELVPELNATLEAVPDFLLITHREGRVLFASSETRALTFEEFERLRTLMLDSAAGRRLGTVALGADGGGGGDRRSATSCGRSSRRGRPSAPCSPARPRRPPSSICWRCSRRWCSSSPSLSPPRSS